MGFEFTDNGGTQSLVIGPSTPSYLNWQSSLPVASAPTLYDVVARGDGTAEVIFRPSASAGAQEVRGYLITVDGSLLVGVSVAEVAPTGSTSHFVTGLENGDSLSFTVTAVNDRGPGTPSSADTATTLTIPAAPTNVQAELVPAGDAVEVTWTDGDRGGSPLLDGDVLSATSGTTDAGVSSPHEFDVIPGIAHAFRVRSRNAVGAGVWSAATTVTPGAEPSAPRTARAVALDGEVALYWTQPEHLNGAEVTDYEIEQDSTILTPPLDDGNLATTLIPGTNGTPMTLRVRAVNAFGASDWSNEVVATPVGAPDAPVVDTVEALNGAARITWTRGAEHGSDVTGHRLGAGSSPLGSAALTSTRAEPETDELILTGLAQGASVSLAVQAVSTGLASSVAESAGAVTPARHARPPTGVIVEDEGDEFVTLSWTPPSDSGATSITEYLITSLPPSGEHVWPAPPATITGLVNGQPYVFFVQALNEVLAEPGAESLASAVAVPRTVPDPPRNLSVSVAGDRSLVATWGAPVSDGGAAIEGYLLVGVSSNGGAPLSLPLGAGVRRHVIDGLVAGAEYDFTLVASNDEGDSTPATAGPVTVATFPEMPVLDGEPEVGDGEATVRWMSASLGPATGHAQLLGWEVCPLPAAAPCAWVGGTASEATVRNLWNGSAYRFEVRARNVVGFGPAAATEDAVVPCSVPAAPPWVRAERAGTGELLVTWAEPWDGGCVIEFFEIDVDADGNADELVPYVPEAELTFDGLVPCDEYSYRVRAENPRGEGPWSRPSEPMRAVDPPAAPVDLIIIPGDECALVRWLPGEDPCTPNVPLLHYNVRVNGGAPIQVAPDRDCWLLTDLLNDTPYTIEVRAENEAGESDPATLHPTVPPADPIPNPVTPTPPVIDSAWVEPAAVAVGQSATLYVQLTGISHPEGTTVSLGSDDPLVAFPVLQDQESYCGAALLVVPVETFAASPPGFMLVADIVGDLDPPIEIPFEVVGSGVPGPENCRMELAVSDSLGSIEDGGDVTDYGTAVEAVVECETGLDGWTLELCPDWWDGVVANCTPIGDGGASGINGAAGDIDPTLLLNGEYLLRLTAFDAADNQIAFAEKSLTISGQQKIGHFTMSFVDMTVPAAGMPIQVVRTYDSRDKRVGDFGVGWRLGFSDVRVEKLRPLHEGWEAQVHGEFATWGVTQRCLEETWAHVVSVIFPDGKVYKFRPVLSYTGTGPQTCAWWPPGYHAWVHYVPVGTTRATLRPIQVDAILGNEGLDPRQVLIDPTAYGSPDPDYPVLYWDLEENDNFAESQPYNPTHWELETEDGTIWRMEEGQGLQSVEDRNGNITEFVRGATGIPGGIFTRQRFEDGTLSASERVVEILYFSGLIWGIRVPTDPYLQYCQDGSQRLVTVRDREPMPPGSCSSPHPETRFLYEHPTHANLVTRVTSVDLSGATTPPPYSRTEYDAVGRMERICQVSSAGTHCVEMSNRSLDGHWQEVTDLLGNPTVLHYDERGNVTERVDAADETWETRYTPDDQPWIETDPLGNVTTHTYDPETGNLLSTENHLGETTHYTWGPNQTLLSIDTEEMEPTRFEYDEQGNLLAVRDPLGNASLSEHDGHGNVIRSIDALGRATVFTWEGGLLKVEEDAAGGLTRYTHDLNGRVTGIAREAEDGFTYSEQEHDGDGKLTRSIGPGGSIHETVYDDHDRPWKQRELVDDNGTPETTDDTWRETENFYDVYGRVWMVRHDDGTASVTEHDLAGNVVVERSRVARNLSGAPTNADDPETVTRHGYDPLLRRYMTCAGEGDLLGKHESWEEGCTWTGFDEAGRVKVEVDERGYATVHEHDAANRRIKTCGPSPTLYPDSTNFMDLTCAAVGSEVETRHDRDGRVRWVKAPGLAYQVSHYDEAGRREYQCKQLDPDDDPDDPRDLFDDPDVSCRVFEHDALGRVFAETDEWGRRTEFGHDVLGRLISVKDAAGEVTRYRFDGLGRMERQEDALGRLTHYEHDVAGRRTARRLPMGHRETFEYGLTGAVERHVDFSGRATTHVIDPETGRVVSTDLPSVPGLTDIVHEYYGDGSRKSVTDSRGVTEYLERNERGQVQRIERPGVLALEHEHDESGHRTLSQVDDGSLQGIEHDFDGAGRMTSVTDHDGTGAAYAWDEAGRLQTITYSGCGGPEVVGHHAYDALSGALLSITWETVEATPRVLLAIEYELDDHDDNDLTPPLSGAGRRTGVTETWEGGRVRVVNYGFDAVDRLVSERYVEFGGAERLITYTYDAVGNRVERQVSGDFPLGNETVVSAYDANDRLVSVNGAPVSWDANGNLTLKDGIAHGWDDLDRMTSAGEWAFEYDVDGVKQLATSPAGTTLHVVDSSYPYAQVMQDRDGMGAVTARYVHGLHPVKLVVGARSWWFLHDAIGSTRALVSCTSNVAGVVPGMITDEWDYEAFGDQLRHAMPEGVDAAAGEKNRWRFAGEERVEGVGLDYLRARWMDPGAGRLVGRDIWEGSPRRPSSKAPYAYAESSPAEAVDPSGHMSMPEVTVAQAVQFIAANVAVGAIWFGGNTYLETGGDLTHAPEWDTTLLAALDGAVLQGSLALELVTLGRAQPASGAARSMLRRLNRSPLRFSWGAAEDYVRKATGGVRATRMVQIPGYARPIRRVIDALEEASGIAHEVKTGSQALSVSAKQQIAADTAMVARGEIQQAVWHFWQNENGVGYISRPLLDALKKANIKVVIHY